MKLHRKLGFWSVFCIASGAMISSGLFVLPGLVYREAGPAVVLAYALAGLLVIPAMMSKAELCTAMPKSGGTYFFIERTMGALPGTFAGLANWFSIALKSAFALVGIGAFAWLIWPWLSVWQVKSIAIASCLIFTALNILSVKGTGWAQILLVVVLLGCLAVFIFLGFPALFKPSGSENGPFAGFMDKGFMHILGTVGMVFVSFGGLTKVASVAGEVRNPGRNIPAGMFAAAFVVTLVYVAAIFVTVGVLEANTFSGSLTPLSLAAGEFMGKPGVILLSIAAMLAFITTANGGILAASRNPMAMSRDGLLPEVMQRVSKRFGTPYVSILLTSVFMITVIAILDVADLVKAASTMMLVLFLMVNVAVIIMRGSKIQNYRPLYRSPFYPWLQLAGIAVYLFLITDMVAEMGWIPLLVLGGFMLAGASWYIVYVRVRITRVSALVQWVGNVVAKEIRHGDIDKELLDIALERDDVTRDRFDRIIADCPILDIPEPISSSDMFQRAVKLLAPRLGMDEQLLFQLLDIREAESSTVIQPGFAIPHVIVKGRNLFDILLLRCKGGVSFPGHEVPVHAAFVSIGSEDERNFHLRALMAISHVVGAPEFFKRWITVPGVEHLRDIVLLSGRPRDKQGDAAGGN
ncbi:MAG: amino acid permease [Phycisphaerae bacterium]|jgi:amino acid transporter/mannitol/fructose-specific phosphotransferase system IIA component (Ntr-type)|nr:amino acid permease [Phycisphaerae bacterium]